MIHLLIPENYLDRRPRTFALPTTANCEAAIIAKSISGNVVSTVGGHG
jgi:hypothetical protein